MQRPCTEPGPYPRRSARRTALTAAVAACAVLAGGAPIAYATLGEGTSSATLGDGTSSATAVRGTAYVETRLFFGTERPDGGPDVTARQFRSFIDRQVTPAFPGGLTVQEGRGQWRDSHGVIERERSYELILLYPASEARTRDPQVERVRAAYEKAFAQDSVARLDERTLADF
ncbi:DUF3574 domain-containing protein [Streptomyces sp. NPDC047737]|uniref:DUF3574 domain-containing protein n=1 Tax=Streptomyces sp. NPDC047737 TaxID=3155740 RepID=UPI0033C72C7C